MAAYFNFLEIIMDRRLTAPDSGSNYQFQDKLEMGNQPRSLFDLSHLHSTTFPTIGSIIPVACIETVPSDSFELSCTALMRALPQVVPLYSKQRLTIHAFYHRMSDLWVHAETFMTRGYTGNTVYHIPYLSSADSSFAKWISGNGAPLYPHMSILPYFIPASLGKTGTVLNSWHINALPLFAYHRIWRDYYINKNYFINQRFLLPDDDCDFRLNDKGEIISYAASGLEWFFDEIKYRSYSDDYFTSAFPSPQRGTAPTLDFTASISNLALSSLSLRARPGSSWSTTRNVPSDVNDVSLGGILADSPPFFRTWNTSELVSGHSLDAANNAFNSFIANGFETVPTSISTASSVINSSITLNQIRELAVAQSELERMAKTDGSYSDFGLTFFGRSSKNSQVFKATYIGGTQQSILYSEVLQTSQTQNTPLGSYAGHGISMSNNGYLGKVDCDDYGYILILASIVPDTYYSQGIDIMWTRSLQSDMYLPDRARLGLRAILNKELYVSGTASVDNNIFAYQNPFDELRYMPNKVSGKLADASDDTFFPYTQSRLFSSTPTFSASFASMRNNVRTDYLVAKDEVPFTCQFNIGCRALRPLPYRPIPSNLGV
ncbi:major capsid protein [Tortoise microvirus 62]|nr:major capsid protein [Tortoise microvirus 62]